MTIEIGSKVTTPVTDAEGEVSYRVGKLININSRIATVEIDGELVKVGKTKIEAFVEPAKTKIKLTESTDAKNARLAKQKRSGIDNGDSVAILLRNKSLDETYNIASEILGETVAQLTAKYGHLNPGQQRMCLGNRIRPRSTANTKDAK